MDTDELERKLERLTHLLILSDQENERLQSCLHGQESVPNLYERIERLTEALHQIKVWSEAYPLDVFPEPDLIKAHRLLEAGGMTLDDISARAMRYAISGVGRIASNALATPPLE